jgi:predicted nucleic acid-binding protein
LALILVDTNILVYLLIEGDRTSSAHELYARDSDWRSEGFILVELSNVLATYVRNRALSLGKGKGLLADAETRLPALRSVSHAQAFETAAEFGISGYDARFIALAKELRVRLVTEDAKLLTAVPSLTRSLADAIG